MGQQGTAVFKCYLKATCFGGIWDFVERAGSASIFAATAIMSVGATGEANHRLAEKRLVRFAPCSQLAL